MLCKNCGTELNENAKFCNSCGAAAEKESVPDIHSVSPENDSGNQQGQYSFSGEPAAADEVAQPGEAAPAEAIDAVEAAPAEAAPAAKKHNVLLYILIALTVIIIAILIFKKPSDSKDPSNLSGEYSPTSYDSGTSLSAEESMVVGTWYSYAIFTNGTTTPVSRHSSTLYIYDNHMGSLYADGELASTFTWYYDKYTEGYHFYNFYFNGVNIIGLYGEDSFILTLTGDNLIVFER